MSADLAQLLPQSAAISFGVVVYSLAGAVMIGLLARFTREGDFLDPTSPLALFGFLFWPVAFAICLLLLIFKAAWFIIGGIAEKVAGFKD